MKRFLFLFLFLFLIITSQSKAQIAVGYYPFQSIIALSLNPENRIFGDFRVETNTFFSNTNMEILPLVNLKRTDWANYYIGAGINFNPLNSFNDLSITNGFLLATGVRVKPIAKNEDFQILFEISPYVNRTATGGIIRTLLGIAYTIK